MGNAASLYQGTAINTATPAELTLMLYNKVLQPGSCRNRREKHWEGSSESNKGSEYNLGTSGYSWFQISGSKRFWFGIQKNSPKPAYGKPQKRHRKT